MPRGDGKPYGTYRGRRPKKLEKDYVPKNLERRLSEDIWRNGKFWRAPNGDLYRRPGSQNPNK